MISKLKQYFDIVDQHNYLKGHEHTGIVIEDISKNMQIYFMFQIKPRNCSISNLTKGLGYFSQLRDSVITTLRKITRDVSSLIGPIIERYEVFPLPVVKNLLLQVLFFLLSLIINLIPFGSPNISIIGFGIYAWQSLCS